MRTNSDHTVYGMSDLVNVATRRAADMGVTIQWGAQDIVPNVDGNKVITFPTPAFPMSIEKAITLRYAVIHEPLHVQRWETMERIKAANVPPKHMHVWNILEDGTMEGIHAAKYIGDKVDIGEGLNLILNGHIESLSEQGGEVDEDATKFAALLMLGLEERSRWDTIGSANRYKFLSVLPKESQQLFKELVSEGWVAEWTKVVTPAEVEELAGRLYKRVYPEGEVREEGGKSSAIDSEGIGKGKIHWSELSLSKHDSNGSPVPGEGGGIDWTGKETRYPWEPWLDTRIIDLEEYGKKHGDNKIPREYIDTSVDAKALANQIRRHLQVMTRRSIATEKRSGKIHNANLYRVAVPGANQEWQSRIFKRRKDGLHLDTAVSVVVDWSGSMDGDKKAIASKSVQRMIDVFERTLHMPVEVLTFGTGYSTNWHGIVKPFAEKNVRPEQIANRFYVMDTLACGNSDADALLWSVKRLAQVKSKRKMLVVLSDGSPSESYRGDGDAGLMMVVKAIKERGGVELYGIGIMDDNVKRYYGTNAKVINNVNELNKVLLETIKQGVTHV